MKSKIHQEVMVLLILMNLKMNLLDKLNIPYLYGINGLLLLELHGKLSTHSLTMNLIKELIMLDLEIEYCQCSNMLITEFSSHHTLPQMYMMPLVMYILNVQLPQLIKLNGSTHTMDIAEKNKHYLLT